MEPRSAERGNVKHLIRRQAEMLASMEPRSAERGNELPPHLAVDLNQLQWSHAQPNVETSTPPPAGAVSGQASMEPRSAERGNGRDRSRLGADGYASMEPRSAERGNEAKRHP